MAQRAITTAEYLAMTDYYAAGIQYILTGLGDEATAASAAGQAKEVQDDIVAFTDPDEAQITADYIDAVMGVVDELEAARLIPSFFSQFNSATVRHLQALLGSTLDEFLDADGSRVDPLWKRYGNTVIDRDNVFPPVTVVGTFAVSGTDAGTFTDGAAVDTTYYAGAQLECEITAGGPLAAEIVATITGTNVAGGALVKTATLTAAAANGAKFDVGLSTDEYVNISDVTITGGTASDAFKIQTKRDR